MRILLKKSKKPFNIIVKKMFLTLRSELYTKKFWLKLQTHYNTACTIVNLLYIRFQLNITFNVILPKKRASNSITQIGFKSIYVVLTVKINGRKFSLFSSHSLLPAKDWCKGAKNFLPDFSHKSQFLATQYIDGNHSWDTKKNVPNQCICNPQKLTPAGNGKRIL